MMPDGKGWINVFIPANIRFNLYPTRESVAMENKMACIPIQIPLISNMQDAYKPINDITKHFKNQFI